MCLDSGFVPSARPGMTRGSPQLADRDALEYLVEARAGGAARVRRQGVEREEAVLDDLAVRDRRALLQEIAYDVERDMVAPRHPAVEIDGEELRLAGELDIALLG